MKKIVITILLLLSSSIYADMIEEMFDSNTDMKYKYKFDRNVSENNHVLAKKLDKFQSGEATEEEIQRYLEVRADSQEKPFASDIKVDSMFVRVDENATNEDKDWLTSVYSTLYSSYSEWFGAEAVPAEDVNTTEEVPVEEDAPAEDTTTEETSVVEEVNTKEGAE